MTGPTQHTLKWLRDAGWTADVVERWIPQARKRKDLFGIIDIVAIQPDPKTGGILGVQCTSGSNVSHRLEKARAEPKLKLWLEAGGKFLVVGWSKKGARGKRKLWTERMETIHLEDLS